MNIFKGTDLETARERHTKAQQAFLAADQKYGDEPGDTNWKPREDALRKRDQAAVVLRRAEHHAQEETARVEREEAARVRAEKAAALEAAMKIATNTGVYASVEPEAREVLACEARLTEIVASIVAKQSAHATARRDAMSLAADLGVTIDLGLEPVPLSRIQSRMQGAIGARKPRGEGVHEWLTPNASGVDNDGWLA